jgi:PAS domain S-box-containing protein
LTRKQAEIALKESQQFIQRIADTTPSILFIFDIEENRNVYCNQSSISILGYTPQQMQSMDQLILKNIIHPDDLAKVKEYYQHIRHSQNEELFVIEYRMIDAEGSCKWFYSQETAFLRNPDGTIKQTIGCASDITKLKEVETRLKSSLIDKEVLLKEVHHRVKNNLGMIDSLLSMQARDVHDAQTLKLLSDSQRRIHTMSLIHEQLYQSQGVGKIDFCEYLHRLTTNLYSSTNFNSEEIQLKLDIKPIFLNIDMAISMGLIVNELLTNCFKHAFPDRTNGLIEVTLQKSAIDQNLHLIIQDDGVGIPENIDLKKTDSLGLRLVRILTQQLRASLTVSSVMGTSFHFTFSENI